MSVIEKVAVAVVAVLAVICLLSCASGQSGAAGGSVRNVPPEVRSVDVSVSNGTAYLVIVAFDANGGADIVGVTADGFPASLSAPDAGFNIATVNLSVPDDGTVVIGVVVTDDDNETGTDTVEFVMEGGHVAEEKGMYSDWRPSWWRDPMVNNIALIAVILFCVLYIGGSIYSEATVTRRARKNRSNGDIPARRRTR